MLIHPLRKILNLPFRIIRKLIKLSRNEIIEIISPRSNRLKDLEKSYRLLNINEKRDSIIARLNSCLLSLDLPEYSEDNGMYSEHLIIFAALSNSSFKPKRILELGTYLGITTVVLSKLFPDSEISTIDLKDDDPLFKNTYKRKGSLEEFIRKRDKLIKNNKKINFIQNNSLFLTFPSDLDGQDLIWVDGAHGYPVVTSDITNCLRLINKKGILMCDDIWKSINKSDHMYSSIAGYETLNSFSEAGLIKTILFRKRISKKYNGNYKFVSLSRLIN